MSEGQMKWWRLGAHFVIWFDVELDLFPGQGADSAKRSDPRSGMVGIGR